MREPEEITNSEDIIDSRDVIKRIEYLQDIRDGLEESINEDGINEDVKVEREEELRDWDKSHEGLELKALKALEEDASGAPDWPYGEVLIRDSYFEDYAKQLAEDTDSIPKDLRWPCEYIDWKAASDALQQDYFMVDFDGVDYWIRS